MPKIIGLMITRDDGWCLNFTARTALRWVDKLLVLPHCPTRSTRRALFSLHAAHQDKMFVLPTEENPDWNEAEYRQHMLEAGRQHGGTHFAIIDGDEALTANLLPVIRNWVFDLRPGRAMMLRWPCLWRSMTEYRVDNSPFGRAECKFAFADARHLEHKPTEDGCQLHSRFPTPIAATAYPAPPGGVMHLQHVEWRRLLAKQALYKMQERVRWNRSVEDIERRYNGTVDETGLELTPVPKEWMANGWTIFFGEEPYQERECKALWEKHGPETFKGLNLFGVVG